MRFTELLCLLGPVPVTVLVSNTGVSPSSCLSARLAVCPSRSATFLSPVTSDHNS